MLVSKKWLSKLVPIETYETQSIAERLTNAGFEIERIETLAEGTNLVIGLVEACEPHPDSDHLHVCQVNVGDHRQQIVCGAPNVATGQKVIVALEGAKLPQITIKKSVIRGVESNGMICSLLELGVQEKLVSQASKTGIEILEESAILGEDPLAFLGLRDDIFDLSLTPNRSDCLAMFSFAKEVGAILNLPVNLPSTEPIKIEEKPSTLSVHSMTNKNPLFLGRVIESVTIGPSPKWIQEALISSGIKSINNVVDISNLVMLETGQPMHFYDIDALKQREITVKTGFNQTVEALDHNEYQLLPEDIVITSNHEPIGIAGVMGLGDSMIHEQSRGIIMEIASFDPVSVRRTSKRLDLFTESSIRYAKPMDPLAPFKAMNRALALLVEYADAKGIEAMVQAGESEYDTTEVMVTVHHINAVLGTKLTSEAVMDVFTRLDFKPQLKQDEVIFVTIPSYRQDIRIAEDLIEEVIRIVGYDAITSTLPLLPQTIGKLEPEQINRRVIEEVLLGAGVDQITTYTLVSEKKTIGTDALPNPYRLLSPLSEERAYVRNQLVHSLLDVLAYNASFKNNDGLYFEVSRVYGQDVSEERLAIIGRGQWLPATWNQPRINVDFYVMKGLVYDVLDQLGYKEQRITLIENTTNLTQYHPTRSAQVCVDRKPIGMIGQLHPTLLKELKLKEAYYVELSLEQLKQAKQGNTKFTPISKFPSVKRDIAIVVEPSVQAQAVENSIKRHAKSLLKEVTIFDVFALESKKSLAISLQFASEDHTLSEDEINETLTKILQGLEKDCQATLREA